MQTINTQAELALFAGTTQGEWRNNHMHLSEFVNDASGNVIAFPYKHADAAFIAHAHNEFPAWMAEIDKGREAQRLAREALTALEEGLHHHPGDRGELRIRPLSLAKLADCLRRIAGEGGQDE